MTGPLTPTFKINEITSISSISNRHLNDVEDLLKKLQEKATKESSYSDNFDELIDQSFESLMNNEKYNEKNVLHKWLKEEIYSVIDLLNEGDENLIKEQQASLKDKIGPQNAFSVLAHAYQLACIFKKNATEGEFDHAIMQLDKALKELAAEVTNVYKPTNTKLIFDSNTVNPEFLKQLQASEAKLKRLIYCGLASIAALGTLWVIYSKLNQPVDLVEDNSNPAKENINAEPKESKKPVFDDHLTVNKSLQNSSSNAADRIKLEEIISNNWTEQNTPPIKNISAPIFTTGIANSEINETNLSLFDAPPPNNADALPLNSSSNTIDGVELEKETISNTSLIKNESAAIFTTNTADLEHNETNLYLFDDPLTNNANTVNSSVELEETISNDLPQQNTSTESIKDASSSIPNRTVERSVSQLNQDYNTFSNGNWRYQTPITEIQNPNVQKNNEQQPEGSSRSSLMEKAIMGGGGILATAGLVLLLVKSIFCSQQKRLQTDREFSDTENNNYSSPSFPRLQHTTEYQTFPILQSGKNKSSSSIRSEGGSSSSSQSEEDKNSTSARSKKGGSLLSTHQDTSNSNVDDNSESSSKNKSSSSAWEKQDLKFNIGVNSTSNTGSRRPSSLRRTTKLQDLRRDYWDLVEIAKSALPKVDDVDLENSGDCGTLEDDYIDPIEKSIQDADADNSSEEDETSSSSKYTDCLETIDEVDNDKDGGWRSYQKSSVLSEEDETSSSSEYKDFFIESSSEYKNFFIKSSAQLEENKYEDSLETTDED